MIIITIKLLSILSLAVAEQYCNIFPNYETGAYTYVVCNDTYVKDLNTSQQFCQEYDEGYEVVTFPNKKEYDFIISQVDNTMYDVDLKYSPGFYQVSNGDKYRPETGKFYWTTDPDTRITAESDTYWQPFADFITNWDTMNFRFQQSATFLLDLTGEWYPSVSLAGGPSATALEGGYVICFKKGVPELSTPSTPAQIVEEEFEYWIVITVAAVVLVIGVLIASICFCCCRKTKHKTQSKHKFEKVAVTENGNHPQQITV